MSKNKPKLTANVELQMEQQIKTYFSFSQHQTVLKHSQISVNFTEYSSHSQIIQYNYSNNILLNTTIVFTPFPEWYVLSIMKLNFRHYGDVAQALFDWHEDGKYRPDSCCPLIGLCCLKSAFLLLDFYWT